MRHYFGKVLALGAIAALACSPAFAGNVTGTVVYEGKVPALKPIPVAAEPMCAAKHPTVPNEMLVLGAGNSMANVLVRVVKGLPAGKTHPTPTTPVVMDQKGCQYVPHVMGIMVNQPFKILNNDGVLHNVHTLPVVNKPTNMAMPPNRKEAVETFAKEENNVFSIKCDVHPWMKSYMAVMTHPFFAVTGADGKFSIPNLPAGTYEVEAWHERLGTQKSSVTVGASDSKAVAFKFNAPAAK